MVISDVRDSKFHLLPPEKEGKSEEQLPKKLSADCWSTVGRLSFTPFYENLVVHHATYSNRTIRVECLRCHHTCQIFKCRFAVGQLSVNSWYTAG